MQQPITPLGSAREISPRKKKGQISFAQSSFMSSIGEDDTINEKKMQNDIEYMYQALRKTKADNELLMARNRQLASDLEEVLASFKETTLKAKLEQESFVKTLRQEKNIADRRLVKATLKSQDRENLLLDWVNSVVSNRIDEKYKYLADLTQRTGVMLPKSHKLAQYICQQQGRPLRTAKGGKRALASRGADTDNDEEQREDGERPDTSTPLMGERFISNATKKNGGGTNQSESAVGFDEDLSVLQNFKKLEDTVSDLASGYANYITADTTDAAAGTTSDPEKGEVKQLFSGAEPHTYHSKVLSSDDIRRSEAERREKTREREEREQQEEEQQSPRSGAPTGKPPKPTSSGVTGKKGNSSGSKSRPASKSGSGVTSAPSSRKGPRRSAAGGGGGSDSNHETDTDNEPSNPGSRGGSAAGTKKKKRKSKSRGGAASSTAGAAAAAADYEDLVNNEDDDESMYRLDRVVGEALFDFNLLNMNLKGSCGTPQDNVARSLSGFDDLPSGGAAGGGASSREYSLYTSNRGGAAGLSRGSDNDGLLSYSPDPAGPYKAPRNGVFNYDGVVDNIMSAVSEMNRSLNDSSLLQQREEGGDEADDADIITPAGRGGRAGGGSGDKYWWNVANKEEANQSSGSGVGVHNNDDDNGEDPATLLNTAINSARMVTNNLLATTEQ